MSQQGVNKWKRNMLKQLYQTMNISMAKGGDKAAMTKIIDLYREDIQNSSKYIKMNKEDAF